MTISTQNKLIKNLSYSEEIEELITNSGGTVIFTKGNTIIASEITEAQYRELLKNNYIEKLDVLPLKRFGDYGLDKKSTNVEIVEDDYILLNKKISN